MQSIRLGPLRESEETAFLALGRQTLKELMVGFLFDLANAARKPSTVYHRGPIFIRRTGNGRGCEEFSNQRTQ